MVPVKLLLVLPLLAAACASQVPYTGRPGPLPVLEIDHRLYRDTSDLRMPQWRRVPMAMITNPTDSAVEVDVDCDLTTIRHLRIPPMTTQPALLDPVDRYCTLRYSR